MKLPRDLSGTRLIKALSKLGYVQVRQIGSHIRLSTSRDHRESTLIGTELSLAEKSFGIKPVQAASAQAWRLFFA